MIRRALKRRKAITEWLHEQIQKYTPKRKVKPKEASGSSRLNDELKGNGKLLAMFRSYRLENQEWTQLEYICALLEPFFNVTEHLSQGDTPTVHRAWKTFNSIFDHLDKQDEECRNHGLCYEGEIQNSVDSCRKKLAHYYGKTYDDKGLLYNLGVMLDPSVKNSIYDVGYFLGSFSSELNAEFV